MHGLSLVIFTVLLFGGIAWLATRTVPTRCLCRDNTSIQTNRGGLESAKSICTAACAPHGGLPTVK